MSSTETQSTRTTDKFLNRRSTLGVGLEENHGPRGDHLDQRFKVAVLHRTGQQIRIAPVGDLRERMFVSHFDGNAIHGIVRECSGSGGNGTEVTVANQKDLRILLLRLVPRDRVQHIMHTLDEQGIIVAERIGWSFARVFDDTLLAKGCSLLPKQDETKDSSAFFDDSLKFLPQTAARIENRRWRVAQEQQGILRSRRPWRISRQ